MKYLVIPNKLKDIDKLIKTSIDGFILGVEGLSVHMNELVSETKLAEVTKYIKENKKEVYYNFNKNIFEDEILDLENLLIKLNKEKVNGIFFYDLSALKIVIDFNLKINLIWGQTYFGTNSNTINFYRNLNVTSALLSAEITLKQILNIKKKTKSRLYLPVFGYFPMSYSRRLLLTNHFKHYRQIKKYKKGEIYYLKEINSNSNYYPVVEEKDGTCLYSNYILNGLKYKELEDIDYGIINGFNLPLSKVIKLIKDKDNYNLFNNLGDGFYNRETIYKVKNEK